MRHRFGWCSDSAHSKCKRAYVATSGVWKGELRMCGCDTLGCPCAVMNEHFPHVEEKADEKSVQDESVGV